MLTRGRKMVLLAREKNIREFQKQQAAIRG